MKVRLTIVNFQVSGAGGGLSPRGRHPAGVLAGVSGCAVADLQGGEGVLAGDLHSVRQLVLQGFVVLQPGGRHTTATAGPGLERCLLSGYNFSF